MVQDSGISWTTHTFNPWIGCTAVGPGCDNCYAEVWDGRQGGHRWGPQAERTRTRPGNWSKPVTWNHKAKVSGIRDRVFVASLADVFDNHSSIAPEWRADLADLIRKCPDMDWLLLTKRPPNIARYLREMFPEGVPAHVIIGITVTSQAEADRDIPRLLAAKSVMGIARVYLSMEPLLGPVNLTAIDVGDGDRINALVPKGARPAVDWVIAGGESGDFARPMHPDWVRGLRDQCLAAGASFHFKQWGEYVHPGERSITLGLEGNALRDALAPSAVIREPQSGHEMWHIGTDAAGREIDGRCWDGEPPALAMRAA